MTASGNHARWTLPPCSPRDCLKVPRKTCARFRAAPPLPFPLSSKPRIGQEYLPYNGCISAHDLSKHEAIQRLLQPSSTIGLTEHYAESGALQQPASQYHPPACNAIWKLVCQRMYIENLRKCSAESVSMCSDLQKQMSRNALCDAVDAIENTSLAPRTIFFRFRPHRQWDCVCVCACPSSHPSTSLRRSGSRVAVSRLFPASKSALAGLYCSETNGSVHARCPSPPYPHPHPHHPTIRTSCSPS